jgi:hypothetical protein
MDNEAFLRFEPNRRRREGVFCGTEFEMSEVMGEGKAFFAERNRRGMWDELRAQAMGGVGQRRMCGR